LCHKVAKLMPKGGKLGHQKVAKLAP